MNLIQKDKKISFNDSKEIIKEKDVLILKEIIIKWVMLVVISGL